MFVDYSNHLGVIFMLPLLKAAMQFGPSLLSSRRVTYFSTFVRYVDMAFFIIPIAAGFFILYLSVFSGIPPRAAPTELFRFNSISMSYSLSEMTLILWIAKEVMVFLAERFSVKYLYLDRNILKLMIGFSLLSFSINLILFADSFLAFTLGWELVGITSVVLIAFYHQRVASVERSFVTFVFYKFGDLCLLSAFLFLANQLSIESFGEINKIIELKAPHHIVGLLLIAAFVKSGLLPFSFWLPRSLEGPTPSSALFYGALGSHAGVFLFVRLLESGLTLNGTLSALVFGVGIVSAFFGYFMSITRSDVKSQLIYTTLTQISVIFIEVALGWVWLATAHCIFNMFLRFFQFLIAPSEIYLAHKKDKFREGRFARESSNVLVQRFNHWIWWLALHEFGLPIFWRRIGLEPLIGAGTMFAKSKELRVSTQGNPLSTKRQSIWKLVTRRDDRGIKKDLIRYILFIAMMVGFQFARFTGLGAGIGGVIFCQVIAGYLSLLTVQEKRLSSSFFYLLFSGGLLINSYYFAITRDYNFMTEHFLVTIAGFSLLAGLFIFFRNSFFLPDDRDFHGMDSVAPRLSIIFGILILFLIGFPGLSTYFSFELMSEGLTKASFISALSGLFILTVNTYHWFNLYGRMFWGERTNRSFQSG